MITIGTDISKLKFDVCYNSGNKLISKSFSNNQKGFEALQKLMPQDKEIIIAMEATGNYSYDLAHYMYDKGIVVYVINPAQIKYYAKSLLSRAKTDKVDAKLIRQFMVVNQEQLNPWKPLSPNHKKLRAIVRCLSNLKNDTTQFGNRIESEKDQRVISLYQEITKELKKRIKGLELEIKALLQEDKDLNTTVKLLESIPGIAETTAWTLLAELPDIKQFKNVKELAAYAGLNPAVKQSGSSVHGRGGISKVGSANLRKCLYLPAMVALRFNVSVKALGDKLEAKGKRPKVIIVAAMHKLLRIIFGILKSGTPFAAV